MSKKTLTDFFSEPLLITTTTILTSFGSIQALIALIMSVDLLLGTLTNYGALIFIPILIEAREIPSTVFLDVS